MLYEIITNKALIIPLGSWAVAQLLKVIIVLIRKKQLELRHLVSSGGMPSSHSALVSALATSVAIIYGLGSVAFAISVILALIVMYDAAGVRQSVGRQAAALNRLIRELRSRRPLMEVERDLREFIGHTQFQVIIGGLVGVCVAWFWLIIDGSM